MSPGHVECKTENTSELFKRNAEKFHFNVPKQENHYVRRKTKRMERKIISNIYFPRKKISGHIQCTLENSGELFWEKVENNALNVWKLWSWKYLFKNSILIKLFLWTQRIHSWQLWPKTLRKKPKTFLSLIANDKWNWFFLLVKSIFFLIKFLWIRRLQFWKCRRDIIRRRAGKFLSCLRVRWKQCMFS